MSDDSPGGDDRGLPPEDRAPAPTGARRVPRGVWLAVALGVAVVGIATFVALGSGSDGPTPEVARLDPTATQPRNALMGSTDAIGKPAPTMPIARFGTDQRTDFAAYRGTPLVVNFFASWCVPCAKEMPAFEQVHQQLGDDVAFLGVDVTDGETPARQLVERTGVTYDIASDPDGEVVRAFGGVNMPTTVFIDADGTVQAIHAGELSAEALRATIQEKLGV